ncbi:TPA: TonB-dependent receptor [Stenotrophomonas maltophilia]|uniref:TonB-dependent receptor n=2 Tax=Stenotrophomonas TaxID=40323 RepID=A0AAJ2MT29_STEMA|nr:MULTISPECIES: TonB-dependent receptor [Stenotrophomonas]MBH1362884.1 TonB-dependent receptor [Stenotrophomonas maltophilia]MDQ7281595.1 TonB-dependent receptor [Stenotrophomonas sp. Sm6012]MDT3468583.1 TonB-dependent receptor [Stenotrophomonas maltophilia]HDS1124264.1 TonB-dependent receptor [Stenotrophomonas maltophilia]HEL3180354.1 TonB-dependent receptor [Stenotrophomonas maltophilia]
MGMKHSTRTHGQDALSLAIALALAAAVIPAGAAAQQAASTGSQDATTLDSVQVTGYRYAIEKSLEQKRDANAVVEVITAEDVGKFPDKNVADALQRVPGVVITRSGGEGKSVSVRGLAPDLTLTQLNGNYVATSETNDEATRSFNYTLLPSNMLSSAELFKSPEARIDEGGIGGTVILHTRRPLDMESNSGFVTLEGTSSDTHHDIDPQASALYSWHSKDERFGVLVGVTQQKRTTRTMEATTEDYQWYGAGKARDANGNVQSQDGIHYWWGKSGFNNQTGGNYSDFFMPTSVNFAVKEEKRERKGGQLTFQFKPVDNVTMTANYFRFELQGDYTQNMLKIPEWSMARYNQDGNWDGGRLLNGLDFDPSGSIVTGGQFEKLPGKAYICSEDQAKAAGLKPGGWGPDDCTMPTPQLTGGYSKEKALSQTADLTIDWDISPLWKASFTGGRTWSEGGPSMNFRMSAKPRRKVGNDYLSGNQYSAWDLTGTPSATFSPDLQQQLMNGIAEVDTGSTDSSWKRTEVKQNYFQADVTKLFESGWLDSIQFGAKYRDGKVHRNTGNTYWVCPGRDPADYKDGRYQAGCDPTAGDAQPGFFLSNPISNIAGGFNANVFPGINYPAYIDYLNKTYGGSHNRTEDDFVYNVNEKIYSGYFQANFRTERLRGNVGVRVVRTKQFAQSSDSIEKFNDYFLDNASGAPMACTDPAAAAYPTYGCESGFVRLPYDLAQSKTYDLIGVDRTYTDVLPSFNIAWDITDTLVLRGAASKVIARPGYTDIATPGALSYYSAEYVDDRRVAGGAPNPGWAGEGSNKQLQPFKATQYDLGLEWYFQPGAVAGVGLFRKDVSNFTVPVVRDMQMNVGGEMVTVQNYKTRANGQDGVSQGVELYGQYTFDFGFGVQANYTYNDTNLASIVLDGQNIGSSPLVGSAKNQANVTVFYENDKFLARASFNRRGQVVGGLQNGMTVYTEPYDQLDLNVAYNLTPDWTLTASVINATKSEQRVHLGNDSKARLISNTYAGRQLYFGATWKF